MSESGIATIVGREFRFPATQGLGIIRVDGDWYLVEFSCTMETLPPKGKGRILSSDFRLDVANGELGHEGPGGRRRVYIGTEMVDVLPPLSFGERDD